MANLAKKMKPQIINLQLHRPRKSVVHSFLRSQFKQKTHIASVSEAILLQFSFRPRSLSLENSFKQKIFESSVPECSNSNDSCRPSPKEKRRGERSEISRSSRLDRDRHIREDEGSKEIQSSRSIDLRP